MVPDKLLIYLKLLIVHLSFNKLYDSTNHTKLNEIWDWRPTCFEKCSLKRMQMDVAKGFSQVKTNKITKGGNPASKIWNKHTFYNLRSIGCSFSVRIFEFGLYVIMRHFLVNNVFKIINKTLTK